MMFIIKEYFFYKEIKCYKLKYYYLKIYKTKEKIHINE
jgi:hypothetical protein